jgi:hypothetical protein
MGLLYLFLYVIIEKITRFVNLCYILMNVFSPVTFLQPVTAAGTFLLFYWYLMGIQGANKFYSRK